MNQQWAGVGQHIAVMDQQLAGMSQQLAAVSQQLAGVSQCWLDKPSAVELCGVSNQPHSDK